MESPIQVSFHGLKRSDALYAAVYARAERLQRYYDRIVSCRVVLEQAGRHKQQGKQFSVHIDLKVPGGDIAVTHKHDEEFQIALRNAFDAARRKLEDYGRAQRGDVKKPRRPAAA